MKIQDWSKELQKKEVPYIHVKPPGPKSIHLLRESQEVITSFWAGKKGEKFGWDLPLTAKRAANALIEDVDGNVFIDLNSGISTQNFGYANSEIKKRAIELASEFGAFLFPVNDYNTTLLIEGAKKLLGTLPNGKKYRLFFANSGTEANEAALKTAISASRRSCVIAMMGGFYGRTMGALSCMAQKWRDSFAFRALRAPNIYFTEGANCPNCIFNEHPSECGAPCIERILKDRVLSHIVGAEEVACIILEPYTTGGLMAPAPKEYIKAIREICTENHIILIFDEVQSGMGRSGKFWVHEYYGIEPDIFTTGKSLGGGVAPLSATFISEEVSESLRGYHGLTYGGSPISIAGMIAGIEYMKKYNLIARVNKLSKFIEKRTKEWKGEKNVFDVRGWGLLKCVDFRKSRYEPLPEEKAKVQKALFEKGVITMGGGQGKYLSLLRIIPPFTIPEEQLSKALELFESCL